MGAKVCGEVITGLPEEKQLAAKDYADAIRVQDACNLSGILYSWAEKQDLIRADAQKRGIRYEHHPINKLFAAKVIELCEMGFADSEQYGKAASECEVGSR